MNRAISFLLLLPLFASGCVSTRIDKPEHGWPKPVAATGLKQFAGVFRDSAAEVDETGAPAPNTTELFTFLLGPEHGHEGDDHRVEIRSTSDGKQLRLRLLDRKHRQIDHAVLHRGTDFKLSGGALIVRRSTGFGTTDSNWGPGVEYERSRLRVTTDGSLIGQDTRGGAALLMAVIPVATAERFYWLWPREAD